MEYCSQIVMCIRDRPQKFSKFSKSLPASKARLEYHKAYDAVDLVAGNPHKKSRQFVKRSLRDAHIKNIKKIYRLLYTVQVPDLLGFV